MASVPRLTRAFTAALCAVACACERAPASDVAPASLALRETARRRHPYGGSGQTAGHLNATLLIDDRAYVANGQDAFGTYHLTDDGGLEVDLPLPEGDISARGLFCTTLAWHAPSRTIYCGYAIAARDGLAAFDLTRSDEPSLRATRATTDPRAHPRSLWVVGDTLYLAVFGEGLLAAPIEAGGALGALRVAWSGGDARFVGGDARRLVVAARERGLVVLEPAAETLRERGSLALDGPPQDLSVRGDRAVVALGSEGAVVVDLSGASPREVVRVRPPGVVTSADLEVDHLAVACTSGVFLYDLSGASPRLLGFSPATSIMLHARFHHGSLIVADWTHMVRYAVDPRGRSAGLDVSWGTYQVSWPVRVSLRNPGPEPLRVAALFASPIEAGETRDVVLDGAPLGQGRDEMRLEVIPRTLDGLSGPTAQVTVLVRGPHSPPLPPPVGGAMPRVTFALSGGGTLPLPLPEGRTRYVYYSADCAAMWTQIEDLDHLEGLGERLRGAAPVFLSREDPARFEFQRRWGLRHARFVYYGGPFDPVPDEVRRSVAPYGEDLYYDTFVNSSLRSGAAHPTDYTVEADGTVVAVERLYRGRYLL